VSNLTLTGQVSTMPQPTEFELMKQIASVAFNSKLLPTSITTKEAALIIVMKGRELGIPPMNAFSSIAVVNGKPTMSAELMLALIYKNVAGSVVDFIKTTNDECVIEAKRPNGKRTTFSFTMKDAQLAGLNTKTVWKQYPQAMLRARCVSAMARAMFPDALSGVVYTPEELGAVVDDEGQVESIPDVTPAAPIAAASLPFPLYDIPEHAGDYKIKFGKKYIGKALKDIEPYEIDSYVNWCTKEAERVGKPLSFEAAELKEAFNIFIEQEGLDGSAES
jgi:hypothetical protein